MYVKLPKDTGTIQNYHMKNVSKTVEAKEKS